MTETRKTFVLKLIAFLKREIEEKLIADRLKDYELRESVSLWTETGKKVQPVVFVEMVLKAKDEPLLAVSFERMDEELAEFEFIDDEDIRSSRSSPKIFSVDTIRSNMPGHPLVSRSLLVGEDFELRVSDQARPKLKALKRQLYKHKADGMIDIFVYTLENLEDTLRHYAEGKLEDRNAAFKREIEHPKGIDEDLTFLLNDIANPQPSKRKLSVRHGLKQIGDEKRMKEVMALNHQAEERVLVNFLSVKPRNVAVQEIDALCAQGDDQATDQLRLACMAARRAWSQPRETLNYSESVVAVDDDDLYRERTWDFTSKLPRDQPMAW